MRWKRWKLKCDENGQNWKTTKTVGGRRFGDLTTSCCDRSQGDYWTKWYIFLVSLISFKLISLLSKIPFHGTGYNSTSSHLCLGFKISLTHGGLQDDLSCEWHQSLLMGTLEDVEDLVLVNYTTNKKNEIKK